MIPLTVVQGDATLPHGDGPRVIAHVCNNSGRWGRGFVLALSRRWPEPEAAYRAWYRSGAGFALGEVRIVPVGDHLAVANMIAQHGIGRDPQGRPPIRYKALERCLTALADTLPSPDTTVHMPRIGCGLAGGTWPRVQEVVEATLCARDIPVTVYDPDDGQRGRIHDLGRRVVEQDGPILARLAG